MDRTRAPRRGDLISFAVYALALTALAAGMGYYLLLGRAKPGGSSYFEARAYTDQVKSLYDRGVIGLDSSAGGEPRLSIAEERSTPRDRQFIELSGRLKRDLKAFNEGEREGMFRYWDGKVVVSRTAHRMPLPYPPPPVWLGTMSFGNGGETLAIANADVMLKLSAEAVGSPITLDYSEWTGGGNTGFRESRVAPAIHLKNRKGRIVATFQQDGERAVLVAEPRGARAILLNGRNVMDPVVRSEFAVERGGGPVGINDVVLVEQDRIRFELADDRFHDFRYGSFAGEAFSRVRVENGRIQRYLDPVVGRSLPMAGKIQSAIQVHLNDNRDAPDSALLTNVNLTIHPILQQSLQAKLADYLTNELDPRLMGVYSDIREQPAAISVVDAFSGHVLALASYPTKEMIDSFPNLTDSQRRGLLQNRNFVTIPVGSTTKPLYAAAIWDVRPILRDLVIDYENVNGYGRTTSVLGVDLRVPRAPETQQGFDNHRSTGSPWNYRSFIAQSSNAYAVSLLMAVHADPSSLELRNGRPVIGGGKPDFTAYLGNQRIVLLDYTNPSKPAADFHRKMGELYSVDLETLTLPNNVDGCEQLRHVYDIRPFAPLLNSLGWNQPWAPCAFLDVLPEKTNLHFNEFRLLRGDLISFAVGGGLNEWTNLKLAEAYARIGSGKMVQTTMVATAGTGASRESPNTDWESLPLDRAVWKMVREGMEDVARVGTAAKIGGDLNRLNAGLRARGLALRLFSKTGTASKAQGREIRDCGAYAFYLELVRAENPEQAVGGLACTIYLEDRKSSGVAVTLAQRILPELGDYLVKKFQIENAN